MKKLFKYTYLALVGMVATLVASCSDSYKYDGRGTWDATDSYANIYFEITDSTLELDPADPTTVKIKVSRRNTQGALTVPFSILENTDDVFTVGEAVFADGAAEAEFTASCPKAEVGKPYTLKIQTTDPALVSKYSAGAIYSITVTRVKWNDVGFYYADAAKTEKVEGYAMYTDDLITFYTGAAPLVYPVKLQERDDQKGIFRMVNAYGEDYPYNDPGDWDASKDYYIIINATDPEKVYISPSAVDMGLAWSYGEFYTLNLAGNYVELAEASTDAAKQKEYLDKAEPYYGKYENGKITFPANSFYMAMAGLKDGAWNWYGNASGAFSLVINPDLDLHNADMTSDEDFKWELVNNNFMLVSGKLGESVEGVSLYKGTCINKEGKCDERFAAEYGTAYKIASPYAEGYDIYFTATDKGEVKLPEEFKYQKTGMKAVGDEVYAVISPAASSFTEKVITLKIAFQTYPDKEGNFIEYGSSEEVLQFLTWTKVGTGMYTYTAYFVNEYDDEDNPIPVTDGPYDIYQRDDKPNTYKVADWGYGGELVFTWDQETNLCTAPISFTGYVDPNHGSMNVCDMVYLYDFFGASTTYDENPCTYDPATKTFTLSLAVFSPTTGYYWKGKETLVVTWNASGSRKAAASKRSVAKNIKAKAKKMNVSAKYSRLGKGVKKNVKTKRQISSATLVK
jgi:hypothetical protein